MSNDTRIPEGARVLYIGGGQESNRSLIGRFGTVRHDDGSTTLPYDIDFPATEGGHATRWWCPREALVHVPNIGDKVVPLSDNGDWHLIDAAYHNAVGTVIDVSAATAANGRPLISAEFQSHQKPDDTVRWSFYNWKPAPVEEEPITWETRTRMIGKTIRVISGNRGVTNGGIYKVTGVYDHPERGEQKVANITVNVHEDGRNASYWVQRYEVIEDGHTLTVSDPFVPFVTGVVTLTGYLDNHGVCTIAPTRGVVSKVEGDIYTVLVDEREFITGPGYVTPLEPAVEEPGELLGANLTITAHEQRIEALERELARANERVTELRDRASKFERDFGRSWERIGREAVERRWCSEYEQITTEVQEELEIGVIPDRPKPRVRKTRRIEALTYVELTYFEAEDENSDDPDDWYTDATGDDTHGSDGAEEALREEYRRVGDFDYFNLSPSE